jgi:hypothetical protein
MEQIIKTRNDRTENLIFNKLYKQNEMKTRRSSIGAIVTRGIFREIQITSIIYAKRKSRAISVVVSINFPADTGHIISIINRKKVVSESFCLKLTAGCVLSEKPLATGCKIYA